MTLLLLLSCAPDPCEVAVRRQEDAVLACGLDVQFDRWYKPECSEAETALLRCEAVCMEAADCDGLVGGGQYGQPAYAAWNEYVHCIQECPSPWE